MLAQLEPQAIFKVDRLTVSYNTGRATSVAPIAGLSLNIYQGEITCILGKSGCGKTTLLKALGGFVVGDDSGGVLFGGRYVVEPTPEIVMIFQENNLFPWLTVRGNVRFGLRFKRDPLPDQAASIETILQAVGLAEASHHYPHQLSGGMRQRTAIARALVAQPQVLLLDEPFSALDVILRRRMQAMLQKLWAETRKTMVMVTHSIEEAILVGHRLIVLGGQPAQVLIDRSTRSPKMKDRYSPEFLHLQQEIESVIY